MEQVTAVVDFGTSHTVVVVSAPGMAARLVPVDGEPWFPSAVFWDRDGRGVAGRDAVRLGRAEPARLERRPKARLSEGEVLLGDAVVPAVTLVRHVLVRAIAEIVSTTHGVVGHLVLTHPADWGATRLGALLTAAQGLVPRVSAVAEPVAAAAWFAAARTLPVGSLLAVLDFGGGTCDAALVRREAGGLVVAACAGLPDLGGDDLDQRIVDYLVAGHAGLSEWLAGDHSRAELERFREDVRAAKEVLSRHPQAEVALPAGLPDTLLTRAEFEGLVRADLTRAVELLDSTVRAAGHSARDVAAVQLVGGSSRVPLLAQLIRTWTNAPVRLDDQPEAVVALGGEVTLHPAPRPGASADTAGRTAGLPGGAGTGGDPAGGDTTGASGRHGEAAAMIQEPANEMPGATGTVGHPGRESASGAELVAGPVSGAGEPVASRWSGARLAVVIMVVAVVAAVAVGAASFAGFRFGGSATGSPQGVGPSLVLPPPVAGDAVSVPGRSTGSLREAGVGEYVDFVDQNSPVQWRLDSFDDGDELNRAFSNLGNGLRPGYHWALARYTVKALEASPAEPDINDDVYLVDDRGLMISTANSFNGPVNNTSRIALPEDCPAPGTTPAAAGAEFARCAVYLVPDGTPIGEVVVSYHANAHPLPTLDEATRTRGARVAVTAREPAGDPPALDGHRPGTRVTMHDHQFAGEVAVIGLVGEATKYLEEDTTPILGGSTAMVLRIAVRPNEPTPAGQLIGVGASLLDERGAPIDPSVHLITNECVNVHADSNVSGTVAVCVLFAVPDGAKPSAVIVQVGVGTDPETWRLA